MRHIRTKIVCTVGPACQSEEMLEQLIDSGMNVARLNFSHGTHEDHARVIASLKKLREKKDIPLAIMLDTKGPEIRVGMLKNHSIQLSKNDTPLLVKEEGEGTKERFAITPSHIIDNLKVGMRVLFDDGLIETKVIEVGKEGVRIEVQNTAILKSQKGVNIPGAELDLPEMTEQDKADLLFGCEHGVDLIAASFIRNAECVVAIKELIDSKSDGKIMVFSKIECAKAVENFDGILQVSDGIMVARGDLGVELPLTHVPQLQKMMIKKCSHHSKPAITATQMLESMLSSPRPTRAEVSDVANAIYDGTSAVMLSGETAIGNYPLEAVKLMRDVVIATEKALDFKHTFFTETLRNYNDIAASLALATVETTFTAGASAIFAYSNSGFTARMMARFRPEVPIIALTNQEKTYHQIAALWGVVPVLAPANDLSHAYKMASCFALTKGYVRYGDLVMVTSGSPFGVAGTTNTMIVENIGDVAARGKPGSGKEVKGNVTHVLSCCPKRKDQTKGKIAVLSHCDASFEEVLEGAIALVLQNLPEDKASEKAALAIACKLKIPVLVRADGAYALLKEDQYVTLDPELGIIFNGDKEDEDTVKNYFCST